MRKITREIVAAFMMRETKRIGNSYTDGTTLYLHDNAIAKFDKDGRLWITNAGWKSNTTKERLNGLPGVSIHQRNYTWYLNDEPWNGDWVRINRW
jgi:beta-xylosidase